MLRGLKTQRDQVLVPAISRTNRGLEKIGARTKEDSDDTIEKNEEKIPDETNGDKGTEDPGKSEQDVQT